ncbi:hypothetical protein C8039_14045 [Halogeometricum sp. wsp3]|nr:hypothetical protein C8039_14045 [Halogeometricum sp. wsp3]
MSRISPQTPLEDDVGGRAANGEALRLSGRPRLAEALTQLSVFYPVEISIFPGNCQPMDDRREVSTTERCHRIVDRVADASSAGETVTGVYDGR